MVCYVFQHIIFFLNGVVAYAIPDVPSEVTQQLELEEKKNKELRRKSMYEQNFNDIV